MTVVLDSIKSVVVPGLGMFMVAYVIFGTGQVKTIWHEEYPTCWSPDKPPTCIQNVECNGLFNITDIPGNQCSSLCTSECEYPSNIQCHQKILDSISYAEFAGIMTSMLVVGAIADKIGRKKGSCMNSFFMLVGLILLTASSGSTLNDMFLMFSISFGIYGFGVGGEYPVAAVSASEITEADSQDIARNPGRGKHVTLVLTMQGWGTVAYGLVLVIALAISGVGKPNCNDATNEHGYDAHALNIIWRTLYGLAIPLALGTFIYRVFYLPESEVWLREREQSDKESLTWAEVKLILKNYGLRLLGTASTWFLWDVAFYGNKLFTQTIFKVLVPDGALLGTNGYILFNSTIALLGCYVSAFTIDKAWMGRLRLQVIGFFMIGLLFFLCFGLFDILSPELKLFLYMLSSFFGQFGPNATTYVIPSEVYPTEIRTFCYGVSAFVGKAGALIGTIVFTGKSTEALFLISGIVSIIGLLFSIVFIPDVKEVSLEEQDHRFKLIKNGVEYEGEAVDPRNMSYAEIWCRIGVKKSTNETDSSFEIDPSFTVDHAV